MDLSNATGGDAWRCGKGAEVNPPCQHALDLDLPLPMGAASAACLAGANENPMAYEEPDENRSTRAFMCVGQLVRFPAGSDSVIGV